MFAVKVVMLLNVWGVVQFLLWIDNSLKLMQQQLHFIKLPDEIQSVAILRIERRHHLSRVATKTPNRT